MLKIKSIQEILNEAKEIKSIEVKKTLIVSAMDKLQRVYDILERLDILPKKEDMVSKFGTMYQQGRFDEVIDGLTYICEDCLNSKTMNDIFYSNKGEWFYYRGTGFLLKEDIIIMVKVNDGLSSKGKLKDYMILKVLTQDDFTRMREIKSFLNNDEDLAGVIVSVILSRLLRR